MLNADRMISLFRKFCAVTVCKLVGCRYLQPGTVVSMFNRRTVSLKACKRCGDVVHLEFRGEW